MLLSGGLDSAIALALATHDGFECHALLVDNGRRHDAAAGTGDPTLYLQYA